MYFIVYVGINPGIFAFPLIVRNTEEQIAITMETILKRGQLDNNKQYVKEKYER